MFEPKQRVKDSQGNIGLVRAGNDPHNIIVDYVNAHGGGTGIYCVVPECEEYDPLETI